MGASLGIMPMPTLIRRIDECVIPDDRDTIVDLIISLERRLAIFSGTTVASTRFYDSNGVPILLNIMRQLSSDEVILRVGFGIFEILRKHREVVGDFIKFGGIELLDKAFKEHAEDDYLRQQLPRVKREILATGADAAMEEIIRQSVSLQLCHKCQEAVERAFRIEACIADTNLPLSYERVNRVLMFMKSYPRKKSIQRVGLDALLFFARNADAVEQSKETDVVPRIAEAVTIFKKDAEICWRGYLSLALFIALDAGMSFESTRLEIHELSIDSYGSFERDPRTQQQILWTLGNLLLWPQSRRKVQTSQKTIDFFKKILDTREHNLKSKAGKVTMIQDKFKPFKVVIPMQIRTFMRETKGELLYEKFAEEKPVIKIPVRKDLTPSPMFGTVHTEHYIPGEVGLL